ncbi:MAG: DNA-binding protein [Desulfobacterales bacterium]|nr:DNA-binding protein [Desulfobacterales bacterium]
MKKIVKLILLVFVISQFFIFNSFAYKGMKWQGSGGWGPEFGYHKMYDPKTVETITGEVISLDKITPIKGMHHGLHLMLKTDNETISVHLGPVWFIENQDIKIEPGDKIEVTGSRITFQGEPAIIAATVKKGDLILELRDENGFPSWSRCRRQK